VMLRLAALLIAGLGAGFLAGRRKLPAGELLAGVAVAAVLNPTLLHLSDLPSGWLLFSQCIVGAGVGALVTRQTLHDFRPFVLAGGLMTLILIVSGLGLGLILWRTTSLDLATAVIGASPGGADQMIILAEDLGANAQLVAAMHVTRQVILMLLVPFLSRVAARSGDAPTPTGAPAATG
jgi:uncharacterized protein